MTLYIAPESLILKRVQMRYVYFISHVLNINHLLNNYARVLHALGLSIL